MPIPLGSAVPAQVCAELCPGHLHPPLALPNPFPTAAPPGDGSSTSRIPLPPALPWQLSQASPEPGGRPKDQSSSGLPRALASRQRGCSPLGLSQPCDTEVTAGLSRLHQARLPSLTSFSRRNENRAAEASQHPPSWAGSSRSGELLAIIPQAPECSGAGCSQPNTPSKAA